MRRWIAAGLAAALALAVCGCGRRQQENEGDYLLYLLADPQSAAGADAIVPRRMDLDVAEDASVEERAAAVVEEILAGGGLWEGIQLRDVTIQGRRAYVDFSRRYAGLTGIQLSLADYCVTLSLTQLEEIASVTITAEGQELSYRADQVLMEQDVLLSTMDDVIETVSVELYFVDESGALAAEQRTLEVYEGESLPESAMEALLEGPQEWELRAVIPEGFEFSGVRVEDRVCTLSLTADVLTLLPESAEEQRLILWSIAKTVYSWGDVDEIQLLVDGEPCETFGQVPVAEIQFRPAEETETEQES